MSDPEFSTEMLLVFPFENHTGIHFTMLQKLQKSIGQNKREDGGVKTSKYSLLHKTNYNTKN